VSETSTETFAKPKENSFGIPLMCKCLCATRMRRLGFGLLWLVTLIATLSQGCYPWGESRERSAAYHGRLLDAETKSAVSQATLEIHEGSLKSSTTSAADGYFRLEALREFRAGIMTLEGLKPESKTQSTNTLSLSISHRNYQSVQLDVLRDTSFWNSPEKTNGTWNGDLELGDILLQRDRRIGN